MSVVVRSAPFRGVLVMGAGLLLLSTCVAAPAFIHSQASAIPFGSAAFAAQWGSIEPVVPNFWGPAVQPTLQEPYVEATGGARTVQYFDKARMEQTTTSGPVTNGLLTVELITGQRQMGDAAFAPFPPASLPVVGDLTNPWPTYAALGGKVFAARVARSGEPVGTVYKPDGTFGLNPGLAAQPAAAYGDFQSDPGGRYGHNIPLVFSAWLAALPLPWQTAMGFPLTEAFWVNVSVNRALSWVLVQPFERRVLSYTPTNPAGFQVEMGNIGQHYSQWRYGGGASAPGDSSTVSATVSGTNRTTTQTVTTVSGTPGMLAIAAVQLGTATDTTVALTFKTSVAATTEVLYGTSSHAYESRQDVSTAATQDHSVTIADLQPGTKYFFALRATANGASVQRKEDYFATVGNAISAGPSVSSPTKKSATPTDTAVVATSTLRATATTKAPSATPTMITKTLSATLLQVTIGADNPIKLAPATMQLENTTVAVSLAFEGTAGTTATLRPATWTRDPIHPVASSTDALPPLTLPDKQASLTITATATIPFTDASNPPLIVSYTRKISATDYSGGMVFTTPPLSSARSPRYNVTLTFALAVA